MHRFLLLLCVNFSSSLIHAQAFETFYETGQLQTRTPLSEEGQFDGLSQEFYPDGMLAAEVPYRAGKVHGTVKEYYQHGILKLQHDFEFGQKQGKMYLYDPDGVLRMYAILDADTILLAQRYQGRGRLISEQIGFFAEPIDTTDMAEPVVWLADGTTLRAGKPNLLRIFIPQFPSSFITFASTNGSIRESGRSDFPIEIIPDEGLQIFTLYLRLKTHTRAQPSVLKVLSLPVNPSGDH